VEHPADRAALHLRSIPVRSGGEKESTASSATRRPPAVQAIGPRPGRSIPAAQRLYTDVLTTMDWSCAELFRIPDTFVNAAPTGMDRPFIVINSGALKLLDDDEMRTLLGHELGHVISGPRSYVTILS